jgi:hypothetical protein
MDTPLNLSRIVRRVLGCTAAGAGVVLFAKPLICLALVVGFFATVGFLLWLPVQAAVVGPQRTWQSVYGRGRRWFGPVGQKCRRASASMCAVMAWATPVVSNLLLEGVSGALVAVVLAMAAGVHEPKKSPVMPLAALCGALAGGLLALTRSRRAAPAADVEPETIVDQGANRSSSQLPSSRS